MSETITYRSALVDDAAQIAELIATGREQTYGLDPVSLAYKELVSDQRDATSIGLIAQSILGSADAHFHRVAVEPASGQSIVGVALGSRGTNADILDNLFVDKAYQGRGVGSLLLGRFFMWATREQSLWLLANNVRARAFYEKHGFFITEGSEYEDNGVRYINMRRTKEGKS